MSSAAPPCHLIAGRGSVEKTVGLCFGFAWGVNGHAVFFREIFRRDVVILQNQALDLALFGRRIACGVIPLEAAAFDREAVQPHQGQQAPVYNVGAHDCIAFGCALEYFEVHF